MTSFLLHVVRWWAAILCLSIMFSFVKNGMANPIALTTAIGQHALAQQTEQQLIDAGANLLPYEYSPSLPTLNAGIASNLASLNVPGQAQAEPQGNGRMRVIEVRHASRRAVRPRARKPQVAKVPVPALSAIWTPDVASYFQP